jgi:outer membrane protein assembly factor BamB/subtilisin family serine protease
LNNVSGFLVAALALIGLAHGANLPDSPRPAFTAKELEQGYSDTTIIAKPRASRRATVDAEEAGEGVRVVRKFARFDDMRVLAVGSNETTDDAIARLNATGRYEYVVPNYLRHATATPNDPDFGKQWDASNTGQGSGTPGADTSAVAAWDVRHDAPGVIVAVIDTGVSLTHADLVANLWTNPAPTFGDLHGATYQTVTDNTGTHQVVTGNPNDDLGHGTHVAGTIGAVGNNGLGIAGIAWNVQIMALKFLIAPTGQGQTSDEISCIDYAIGHGAQIINASFGENGGAVLFQPEMDAIGRARAAGIIFVAAAGNDAANMDVSHHYPASMPLDNIVAVGASTEQDDIAVFSNYGAAVDLFAPGNNILSLDYNAPAGGTRILSGTSMAAPHVVGALALLKAQFPSDNYRQLINRLLRGTDVGGKFTGKAQTGGRLNLLKALTTTTNRPFNDDFADRPRLSGDNLAVRSNNGGATAESNEPAHAGIPATATLWWEWTASGNVPVTVSTAGSAYDTVLAIYTIAPGGGLTPVASNDDAPGLTTSAASFTATAGTKYEIAVDGKNGASGLTLLNLSAAPSNDSFATPIELSGVSTHVTATNVQASREAGEPLILGNAGGTSLWYRWTAPKSGHFEVSVYTLDFDPFVAIYTGSSLGSLSLVAANDNSGFDGSQPQSVCAFDAVAGTTYRITMDARALQAGGSVTGEFTLGLTDAIWQAATGNSSLRGDSVTGSAAVAADGTIYFGASGNEHTIYALNPSGSLKWRFNASGATDTASPAVGADGTIYVGTGTGNFYALNPTGTRKWLHAFGSTLSASNSPAIAADGTIYAKVSDGFLYALDPAAGTTKWSFDTHGKSSYASPAVATDGTIYIGSDDDHLYAVNPDGTQKWAFATSTQRGEDVYSTPAIDAAGNVYFGTLNSGRVFAVTPAGAQRWAYAGSFDSISSSPALSASGDTLYIGSYDRRLHAIDTATGAARWTAQLGGQVRASSPAVDARGVIYIGALDDRLYAINPDGTQLRVYDTGNIVRSCPAIVGNTLYVGSNDNKMYAFDIGAPIAAGPWSQYRAGNNRVGRASPPGPLTILSAPASRSVGAGQSTTLAVSANGGAPLAYQWLKDGATIIGATSATYTVANATTASAGSYAVAVTGPQGSVTTSGATVTVTGVTSADPSNRLVNLSVRTSAGTGAQTLIVGFVTNGGPVLVRGVGPSLTAFGVPNPLADPQLALLSGSSVIASNDNWGGGTSLRDTMAAVGAFPLDPASKDAALVSGNLPAGNYTAQVTGGGGATGAAIAEIYDTVAAPGGPSRLINISARAQVDPANVLIAGFVVTGTTPKKVLITGIGPELTSFGVTGTLADPRVDLFDGAQKVVASNDDWSGATALLAASTQTGALLRTAASTSKSAALLVVLSPGNYTAQVSSANGAAGVGLVEVYEVP